MLGLASAVTVIVMSRPRVGSDHGGWLWAAAMTGLLPVAAAIIGLGRGASAISATAVEHGLDCLTMGSGLAFLTFAVLVWWLRRVPTSRRTRWSPYRRGGGQLRHLRLFVPLHLQRHRPYRPVAQCGRSGERGDWQGCGATDYPLVSR